MAWGSSIYIFHIYIYIYIYNLKNRAISLFCTKLENLANRMQSHRLDEAWNIYLSVPFSHFCLLLAKAAHPGVSTAPQIRHIPGDRDFALTAPPPSPPLSPPPPFASQSPQPFFHCPGPSSPSRPPQRPASAKPENLTQFFK